MAFFFWNKNTKNASENSLFGAFFIFKYKRRESHDKYDGHGEVPRHI